MLESTEPPNVAITAEAAVDPRSLAPWIITGQSACVTTSFDGLLDPSTYADDEPVRIAADEVEFSVSERVWNRLWHIGYAYDLHLLKLLDGGTDVVTLNAIQAAALSDELAFVPTVTTDRMLMATIDEVGDLAQRAAHSGRDGAFSVEGP